VGTSVWEKRQFTRLAFDQPPASPNVQFSAVTMPEPPIAGAQAQANVEFVITADIEDAAKAAPSTQSKITSLVTARPLPAITQVPVTEPPQPTNAEPRKVPSPVMDTAPPSQEKHRLAVRRSKTESEVLFAE
jgi:hypothetical protein